MASGDAVLILFQNDGGEELLSELDTEEHPIEPVREALGLFLGVVRESLEWLCSQPQFSHVQLAENSESKQLSAICLGACTPVLGADGGAQPTNVRAVLDIQGLLTAKVDTSAVFGDKVAYNEEEGIVQIQNAKLQKQVDRLLKTYKPVERLQSALSEEQEQVLVEALASLCPPIPEEEEGEEGEEKEPVLEPVHPADLLILLAAYMFDAVGEAPKRSNPFQRVGSLVGGVLGGGARNARSLRKVVWQAEDIALGGARLALRVAQRAARPLLLVLMLRRVTRTLSAARAPEIRMARMSPSQQVTYHMERMLGPDWQQQVEQDFLEAAKEVQEGLITEDYKDEKRKMTAAMLRRLEIEDWDKERMKHFYYGSYGLGSWYFDMEERLHNPYFMGARGWNGPIEQWVGKNKAYQDAVPAGNVDFTTAALDLIEASKGVKLTPQQRQRIERKNSLNTSDLLISSDFLTRSVDKAKLRQALALPLGQ